MEETLVSIIVSTYNRPDWLAKCLASIKNQLAQNFEVVAINDAGEDVEEVVKNSGIERIKYITHDTNKGLGAARNTGIENSTAKYICFLDDDDVIFPNYTQMLVAILEQGNLDIIYCDAVRDAYEKNEDGTYHIVGKTIPYSIDPDLDLLLVQNITPVNAVMFSREIMGEDRVDENMRVYEDWTLWIRLFHKARVGHYSFPFAAYSARNDGSTMSSSRKEFTTLLPEIYKKYRHLATDKARVYEMQNKVLNSRSLPIIID